MRIRVAVCLFAAALFLSLSWVEAVTAQGKGARPDPSKVVLAVVKGKEITLADLEAEIKTFPAATQIQIRKRINSFLDSIVDMEVLFQEAVKKKYDELSAVRKRLSRARRRIVLDEFIRKNVNEKIKLTDTVLKNFFEQNKGKFDRKESVTLSHIVVKTEEGAKVVLARLREGAPFSEMAKKHSIIASTRESGGVIGTVERGQLDGNLEEVAFSMPIGQVSEPVSTPQGWQIIRVTEKTSAAEARLEDVKDDVEQFLTEALRRKRYQALLENLRKREEVQVFPERIP